MKVVSLKDVIERGARTRNELSRRPPNLQAQAKQRSTRQRAGVGSTADAEELQGESGACLQVLGAAHDRLRPGRGWRFGNGSRYSVHGLRFLFGRFLFELEL